MWWFCWYEKYRSRMNIWNILCFRYITLWKCLNPRASEGTKETYWNMAFVRQRCNRAASLDTFVTKVWFLMKAGTWIVMFKREEIEVLVWICIWIASLKCLGFVWLSSRDACGEHLKNMLTRIKGWTRATWTNLLKRQNRDETWQSVCANVKGWLTN